MKFRYIFSLLIAVSAFNPAWGLPEPVSRLMDNPEEVGSTRIFPCMRRRANSIRSARSLSG
jgi:hypothetical protein